MKKDMSLSILITMADLQEVKNLWIREVQALLANDPKFHSWQQYFGLFTDEHRIWRCGRRLAKTELSFNMRHPVLLDQRHHFTTLVAHDDRL